MQEYEMPISLQRLWFLAEREAEKVGVEAKYVFESIGLTLWQPLTRDCWYDATPRNTSTFADVGGDGVHYGLLHIEGQVYEDSPVVMTVPSNFDKPNMFVGKDLIEFLSLGCQVGYGDFEQLLYYPDKAVEWLSHPETGLLVKGDFEPYFVVEPIGQIDYPLNVLVQEFDLRPWEDIERRLAELQERYLPILHTRSDVS